MEHMSPVAAVKKFIERGAKQVTLPEMQAFWRACKPSEKVAFGEQAAMALGVELEYTPAPVEMAAA